MRAVQVLQLGNAVQVLQLGKASQVQRLSCFVAAVHVAELGHMNCCSPERQE